MSPKVRAIRMRWKAKMGLVDGAKDLFVQAADLSGLELAAMNVVLVAVLGPIAALCLAQRLGTAREDGHGSSQLRRASSLGLNPAHRVILRCESDSSLRRGLMVLLVATAAGAGLLSVGWITYEYQMIGIAVPKSGGGWNRAEMVASLGLGSIAITAGAILAAYGLVRRCTN